MTRRKLRAALNMLQPEERKHLLESHGLDREDVTDPEGELFTTYEHVSGTIGAAELAGYMRLDMVESDVYSEQIEWAEEEFGKDVHMNVGWAVDGNMVQTKIYGHGILTTWFDESGSTDQEFEEFY